MLKACAAAVAFFLARTLSKTNEKTTGLLQPNQFFNGCGAKPAGFENPAELSPLPLPSF